MSPRSESDFESSDEKALIRRFWDYTVLTALAETKRPLSYFGLPGPNIQDLLNWRSMLGFITGVERLSRSGRERELDLERHRRLHRNVMQNDISDFQLLRGDIDDVILDGLDLDSEAPRLHRGSSQADMRFYYDLVNLDYVGGVGYLTRRGARSGESKRVRAIKKLFDRQQGTEFVLLLTVNVRDTIDNELRSYLQQTRSRVVTDMRGVVDWYSQRGDSEKKYVLKAVVPLFVQRIAEDFMFKSHCYPPIAYGGSSNATMVHFAFRLLPAAGNLQAFSDQSVADLLNLPLVVTERCLFRVAAQQHPSFDFGGCTGTFSFLPEDLRDEILSNLPSPGSRSS